MLNANTERSQVTQILNQMTDKKSSLKLLYVTPEKLAKSKRFMAKLQKSYEMGTFKRLAIDEVHCCSTWGHDFRPDYKFLGVVRNLCPQTPILGKYLFIFGPFSFFSTQLRDKRRRDQSATA